MATTGTRPLRADAVRNRRRVLAAAETLLARHGQATSMRDIAAEAGVGLATVYRQFPTKEDLYAAMVADQVRTLTEQARSYAAADDPGGAFFAFFAQAVAGSTGQKVLVDGLTAAGVDVDATLGQLNADLHAATEHLLQRAQATGTVRDDIAMPEVLGLLSATCLGAERQHWNDQLRDRILGVVFDGLFTASAVSAASGRPTP